MCIDASSRDRLCLTRSRLSCGCHQVETTKCDNCIIGCVFVLSCYWGCIILLLHVSKRDAAKGNSIPQMLYLRAHMRAS